MDIDIYPSILEKTASDFFSQLMIVSPFFNHVQIDIADGSFVPQKTVQIEELETKNWKLETGKTFEFHLMVQDYENELKKIEKLKKTVKITAVLIHLQLLHTKYQIPNTKYEIGIVLNPEDEVASNWKIINQFNTVQLMTVHPGTQGSLFVPEVLDKIAELKEHGFNGKIILDGAMNDKTLPLVLQQKNLPNAICPGSYFKEDVAKRLSILKKMITKKDYFI